MQGSIRPLWELFIMSLMKFLIRTGLIMCVIQLAEQNLRDLVSCFGTQHHDAVSASTVFL